MSKITYEEFTKRFELTKQYRGDPLLRRNQYRDRLHRRNCTTLEYTDLTEEARNQIFSEFSKLYNPNYSLHLSCYTEKISGLKSDLIFVLDECDTLTQHLWDKQSGKVLTLEFKELLYIFKRISQILSYYHGLGYNHGDITEGSIYIDQDKKARLMFFPQMRSNMEKAAIRISSGESLQHTGYLLSPEQMALLINRTCEQHDPNDCNIDKYKNDIFSLGLMALRIVSPIAFYEGYDLLGLRVDLKRLYTLVDTLGVFLNNHFMAIVRDCLSYDQSFRPSANFLVTEMEAFPPSNDRLNPTAAARNDNESILMHEDHYTGYKVGRPNPNQSIALGQTQNPYQDYSKADLKDISHDFGHKLESIRVQLAPNRFSLKKNTGNLSELKKECLHFIENDIYGNLAHSKATHRPYGELSYKVKILNNNKKVGFILYPNGDVYFGYLRDLKRDDIGVYFLSNGEVYHGEFRKGKIEGVGTYIFLNGDVFDGSWKDNLLDGQVKMYQKKTGDHHICKFVQGHLQTKSKNNMDVVNSMSLEEFYRSYVMKSLIVQELTKEHILMNTQRLELNRLAHRMNGKENNTGIDKEKFDKFSKLTDAYLDLVTTAGKKPPRASSRNSNSNNQEDDKSDILPSTERSGGKKKEAKDVSTNQEQWNQLKNKKGFNLEDYDYSKEQRTLPTKGQDKSGPSEESKKQTIKKKAAKPGVSSTVKNSKPDQSTSREKKQKKQSTKKQIPTKKTTDGKRKKQNKDVPVVSEFLELDIDHENFAELGPEDYEYQGGKKDGKYDGFGHFYFKNGCRFYGNFTAGVPNGKGTFFYKNGKHIDGVWLNGAYSKREDNFSYDAENSDNEDADYLNLKDEQSQRRKIEDLETPELSDASDEDEDTNRLLVKRGKKSKISEDSDEDQDDAEEDYLAGV